MGYMCVSEEDFPAVSKLFRVLVLFVFPLILLLSVWSLSYVEVLLTLLISFMTWVLCVCPTMFSPVCLLFFVRDSLIVKLSTLVWGCLPNLPFQLH